MQHTKFTTRMFLNWRLLCMCSKVSTVGDSCTLLAWFPYLPSLWTFFSSKHVWSVESYFSISPNKAKFKKLDLSYVIEKKQILIDSFVVTYHFRAIVIYSISWQLTRFVMLHLAWCSEKCKESRFKPEIFNFVGHYRNANKKKRNAN